MCPFSMYMLDEMNIKVISASLTASAQLIIPADPMRYAFTIGGVPGQTLTIWFTDGSPSGNGMIWTAGQARPFFNLMDIGELVQLPVWMNCVGGAFATQILTISFDPKRFGEYQRYANKLLSNA